MSDITLIPRPDVHNTTPYHFSASQGSKAGFLLDYSLEDLPSLTPSEVIPRRLPTRRDLLKIGTITTGGLLLVGLRPQRARADFGASFFVGAFLTAGIIWLTNRLLNTVFPPNPTPDDLGLRRIPNPTPSHSRFHNSFAAPYEVTNRRVWQEPRRLPDYGLDFGLRDSLLLKDMNGIELRQLEREEEYYGGPLLPVDLRRPYDGLYHRGVLTKARQVYDLPDLTDRDVRYVRTFRDNKKREHIGLGVVRGEKAHLLVY